GKTRLALRAAAEVSEGVEDRLRLVDLAPVTDQALVPQAVAFALGVSVEPDQSILRALARVLGRRRLLLFLDSCEHVLQPAAGPGDALLRDCPDLTVLATSREPLGVAGEVSWRVPSLATPAAGLPGARAEDRPSALARYDAVRLFVDRARAHLPS